jgi:predicted transposase YbfD/YdcC
MEQGQEGTRPGFLQAFEELEDPRTRNCPHRLDELLLVALCANTSGADSWMSVVDWGRMKLDWLRRFLPFDNGIASHDTFTRVFSLLDAQRFEACFISWMRQLCPALQGELVSIDGKSVRGSHDGGCGAIHLVSAWHSAAGLVLGQVKTAAKSNEITAIPELLDALDVRGATITIDAMGCQRAIVDKIIEKKADYIVAVKDNQPTLAQAVESLFETVDDGVREGRLQQDVSVDKGHGRIETRRCVVAQEDVSTLAEQGLDWPGLRSAMMIESTREAINGKKKGERSTEWRYYISSLRLDASDFNARVRAHWGIENSCHWVLDMTFDEDDCRIRKGDGAQNFAILRRIALNLIKQEKSDKKTSLHIKRLKAGWSTDYLQTLLGLRPL